MKTFKEGEFLICDRCGAFRTGYVSNSELPPCPVCSLSDLIKKLDELMVECPECKNLMKSKNKDMKIYSCIFCGYEEGEPNGQ